MMQSRKFGGVIARICQQSEQGTRCNVEDNQQIRQGRWFADEDKTKSVHVREFQSRQFGAFPTIRPDRGERTLFFSCALLISNVRLGKIKEMCFRSSYPLDLFEKGVVRKVRGCLSQEMGVFRKSCEILRSCSCKQESEASMFDPFRQVALGFIMTFGITPPRPEQELRATILICMMLVVAMFLAVGSGLFTLRQIS